MTLTLKNRSPGVILTYILHITYFYDVFDPGHWHQPGPKSLPWPPKPRKTDLGLYWLEYHLFLWCLWPGSLASAWVPKSQTGSYKLNGKKIISLLKNIIWKKWKLIIFNLWFYYFRHPVGDDPGCRLTREITSLLICRSNLSDPL